MPALTINTGAASRTTSPQRPPMSPITPTETPSSPVARPAPTTTSTVPPAADLSHTTHPAQQPSRPAPPPQPIDFDDNADAIALRSAISVLQLQRRKADQQIKSLYDCKADAVANPEATIQKISDAERSGSSAGLPWKDAFKPQSVANCPDIRWDQYAVVGASLDKLHQEQVTNPAPSEPAAYTNGVYEFKSGVRNDVKPDEYRGPLAPYSPWKDHDRADQRSKPKK